MNKPKTVFIFVLFLTLLFLLYYIGPFFLRGLVESSLYRSEEVDIGPIDYSSVLTKAEKAGYEVEGSWPWPGNFSGFEPGDVPEVRESFGSAALVKDIRFNYGGDSELAVSRYKGKFGAEAGAHVILSNLSHSNPEAPLQLSKFPEDSWLLEKIGLLFGLDEKASENYLVTLKKAAQNQTWEAEIEVSESPDFPAVYAYLMENKTETEIAYFYKCSPKSGADTNTFLFPGSYEREIFLKNGSRLGSVGYFVPKARVVTFDKENRYTLELRGSGEVWLEIAMPKGSSGEKIPEEEYRAVFREIFENLGLSPKAVDNFEFFYSTSRVW